MENRRHQSVGPISEAETYLFFILYLTCPCFDLLFLPISYHRDLRAVWANKIGIILIMKSFRNIYHKISNCWDYHVSDIWSQFHRARIQADCMVTKCFSSGPKIDQFFLEGGIHVHVPVDGFVGGLRSTKIVKWMQNGALIAVVKPDTLRTWEILNSWVRGTSYHMCRKRLNTGHIYLMLKKMSWPNKQYAGQLQCCFPEVWQISHANDIQVCPDSCWLQVHHWDKQIQQQDLSTQCPSFFGMSSQSSSDQTAASQIRIMWSGWIYQFCIHRKEQQGFDGILLGTELCSLIWLMAISRIFHGHEAFKLVMVSIWFISISIDTPSIQLIHFHIIDSTIPYLPVPGSSQNH